MASMEVKIGKIFATLGIGIVAVANTIPEVSAEYKTFANSIGLAFTSMSVYLMHDTNGKKEQAAAAEMM